MHTSLSQIARLVHMNTSIASLHLRCKICDQICGNLYLASYTQASDILNNYMYFTKAELQLKVNNNNVVAIYARNILNSQNHCKSKFCWHVT